MKKILLLLLISVFTMSGVFAQDLSDIPSDYVFNYEDFKVTDPETGEVGLDIDALSIEIEENNVSATALLPILLDPDDVIGDIVFSDFIPEVTDGEGNVVPLLNDEALETIKETLKAENPEMDDSVINGIADAASQVLNDGVTLGTIKEDDPDTYLFLEDVLITAAAEQVKGSLISEEQELEMADSLVMAAAGLKLLNGFAQSTANSAISNSLFGYQDYKLFTFSVGTLGSFSMPTPMETAQDVLDITELDLETNEMISELDALGIEAGVTFQGITFSLGLNLSWLVDDLYASIILGSTEASVSTTDGSSVNVLGQVQEVPVEIPDDIPSITLEMGSSIYGFKVNYQFLNGFGIPVLFRWNGLSLGTGFIQTNMHTSAKLDLSSLLDLPENSLGTVFSIESNVSTIPVEISTGFQLLSIATVTAGAGVDLQVGSSSVKFDLPPNESIGAKMIKGILDSLLESNDDLNFPYEGIGDVMLVNPRISAGVGVGLGPIVFDVSAHYFLRTGVAIGANVVIRI